MKQRMYVQKVLVVVLSLALVFSGFGTALASTPASTLVIFHTNDVHSRVEASASQVGYSRIATIVSQEKEKNPNVLLLDAGDAFHGQSIANVSKGESIVKIMNAVGYDAMVTGNHDFNFGQERLLELKAMADFDLLAANVVKANGQLLLKDYVIKTVGGKKILIFGLATPETTFKTHPNNVTGLEFIEPWVTAQKMVNQYRSQVDFIIALSHLGLEGDYTSQMVAEKVSGIDLIIDGHSHDTGELVVNNTVIVQTSEYNKNLGKVTVDFSGSSPAITSSLITPEMAADFAENENILSVIATYQEEVSKIHAEVIGSTTVNLEGSRDIVRTSETNLGNIITDAVLDVSGADLALTNGGGMRTSISAGQITRKNVFDVMPFGNLIVVKEVPGSVILDMLEFSVRLYPESNGGFLHGAGIMFKFDESKPPSERVHSVMIQGKPLEAGKMYRLATNDFLGAGGDGYAMLKDYPVFAEMISLEEAFAGYITKLGGTISPVVEGRITKAPMPSAVSNVVYLVRPGDTLGQIAARHNTTWQELQRINQLTNPHLIFPQQQILIPAS